MLAVGVGTKLAGNKRGTFSAQIRDKKKKKTRKNEKDKYYKTKQVSYSENFLS